MGTTRTAALRFHSDAVRAETHVNLSAVRADGHHLWVGGDESATVERFTRTDAPRPEYAEHVSFDLTEVLDLPGGADEEIDVEGLARRGPYLWVVGSHSAKRKKPKAHHSDAKAAKRLATVVPEPARRVLARVALSDGVPVRRTRDGARSAALGEPGLRELLADDPHLAPFLPIPGKDNGFDVEGIAVHGEPGAERVLLGLRGPVLRGWAVVLRLAPREEDGELVLRKVDGHRRYAKHFLDLDGLGVRDLCPHGDDLLVLAGPSMALSGPVRLYRWPGAARADLPEVVRRDELVRVADLPHGEGRDHAEGITVLPGGDLLVVHDSPAPARLPEPGTVLADVLAPD
ncbi:MULTISPECIES: DUF3616 domain-containing protein [unclassified Saccharopolyspora]|uniref:DUF3616 domain-containing protein n=1 Tax=unclassified Saccharopolyspora TaxID=2646250 RepID=UPI001CD5425A|nr:MULTISPECIES: DUF3616 domain-containing protein [unclassified Saccharopolyspora]MCA1194317.1 DUF3616 domain-containing protein [Saccharopolyspora sp. 6V]MCA1227235.1 DUF3616 domain-containing protein [Saccharopolyspora sp. 6M]